MDRWADEWLVLADELYGPDLFVPALRDGFAACRASRGLDPDAFARFERLLSLGLSQVALREHLHDDTLLERVVRPRLERELGAILVLGEPEPVVAGGEVVSLWAHRAVDEQAEALLAAADRDLAAAYSAHQVDLWRVLTAEYAREAAGGRVDAERAGAARDALTDTDAEWLYALDGYPELEVALRRLLSQSGLAATASFTAEVAGDADVMDAVAAHFSSALRAMAGAVDPQLEALRAQVADLHLAAAGDPEALATRLHAVKDALDAYRRALGTLADHAPPVGPEIGDAVAAVAARFDGRAGADPMRAPLPSEAEDALDRALRDALLRAASHEE